MAIEWGLLLKRGLGFCWSPKRWLPFFITDLACTLLVLVYIYFNMGTFLSMLTILSLGNTAYLSHFLLFLTPIILLGIVCALINLWISGAVIHQSYREKEFRKSWGISCKRYPKLLAVVIVTGILTYLVSLSYISNITASAAYIGVLLSFIVSAILYFPLQIIIVKRKRVWDSLVGSWQLFRDQAREKLINRKNIFFLILISEILSMPILLVPGYLTIYTAVLFWILCWFLTFAFLSLIAFSRVCDVMMLVSIISLVIVLVFSIPFLLILYNVFLIIKATSGLGAGALALLGMKSIIRESLLPLASSGIILLIGVSISKAFSLKAKTEFYLKFRKRILGIF